MLCVSWIYGNWYTTKESKMLRVSFKNDSYFAQYWNELRLHFHKRLEYYYSFAPHAYISTGKAPAFTWILCFGLLMFIFFNGIINGNASLKLTSQPLMIIQRCPVEDTLKGVHDLVESGKNTGLHCFTSLCFWLIQKTPLILSTNRV